MAEQEKTTAVAVRDAELDRFARLGQWLAAAENTPQQGPACALRLFMANELGLPLRAAAELSIIKGRLVCSAQLLRAFAREAGYDVVRVEEDDQHCIAAVVVRETGEELGRSEFTMEDAEQAELIRDGSGWTKYPKRMLWARASSWALRDYVPEVTLGLVETGEAEEIRGVVVAEEDVPAPEEPPSPASPEPTAPPAEADTQAAAEATPEELGELEHEGEQPEPEACRTCGATEPAQCQWPDIADTKDRAEGCIK